MPTQSHFLQEDLPRSFADTSSGGRSLTTRRTRPSPGARQGSALDPAVATVVHELSNALSIVDLQSRLLALKGGEAGTAADSIAIIQEQIGRMGRMIDSLRRSMDPLQPVLRPTDIHELLRHTLDLYREDLEQKGIGIRFNLAPLSPPVLADRDQLQQVFVNLINNARQAMLTAGVGATLTVETEALRNALGRVSALSIQFSDDGPGIAPQILPRIFEPFFTTKTAGDGMGLGLAICKQLIQRHGGQMWAQNNTSGGATFAILLPVEGAEEVSRNWGKHILVIDDEKALADSLRRVLGRAGYRVTVAHDARQALTVLQESAIDLIISDLTMPQMDGRQLWQTVRDEKPEMAWRIVFSTGDSSRDRYGRFLDECGCAWLKKPYQEPALLEIIERTLQRGDSLAVSTDPVEMG